MNTGRTHFKKGQVPWNKRKEFSKETRLKMSLSHLGKPSWNKGKKMNSAWGERLSQRNRSRLGEMALNWKRDNVGYYGIHKWISKMLGKASKCENQNCVYPRKNKRGYLMVMPKRYEWANLDHKYKRDIKDYIQFCPSCHRQYDIMNN